MAFDDPQSQVLVRTMIPTAFDLHSEQVSNSNLTKTHGRATLNVPVTSSESLNKIAKPRGTTISRMKTKVNTLKLVVLGNGKILQALMESVELLEK